MRESLLRACPDAGGDVRLIGLVLAIKQSPGAAQAAYARYLGIDLNTAGRLIGRAEETGLLRKETAPHDRRAYVLVLTDGGLSLAARGMAAIGELEARLAAQVGAQEMRGFRRMAEQILTLLSPRS
jgi:DNA-binding MarR family transcriptional regulator